MKTIEVQVRFDANNVKSMFGTFKNKKFFFIQNKRMKT